MFPSGNYTTAQKASNSQPLTGMTGEEDRKKGRRAAQGLWVRGPSPWWSSVSLLHAYGGESCFVCTLESPGKPLKIWFLDLQGQLNEKFLHGRPRQNFLKVPNNCSVQPGLRTTGLDFHFPFIHIEDIHWMSTTCQGLFLFFFFLRSWKLRAELSRQRSRLDETCLLMLHPQALRVQHRL